MDDVTEQANPAELAQYDPDWANRAQEQLSLIRDVLSDCIGADAAQFDHIGSTSVPGLAAKPTVDLQVRISPLPSEQCLAGRLGRVGYARAFGARPDSPGVYRDIPRGGEEVPDEVWEKRIFVAPAVPAIVHIRRQDSPWGRYTVWFRDWLRANRAERDRYERIKRTLSEENRGKLDYDDYTRAKTAFFDEVQDVFTAWAAQR